MKLRTRKYITRQKAIRNMIQFTDLKSFLLAGFQASRSVVVKKDIINMLIDLDRPVYAKAS
jgi:hypothetical protein